MPSLGASFTAANVGGQTVVVEGVSIKGNDSSWGAAIAAAEASDAIVLALGTDRSVASEGTDLTSISLPGVQSAFAKAVIAAAKGKPVVFLLVSSFPIAFEELWDAVDGVVLAYTPGFGAQKVVDALFGANRWGRSIFTVRQHWRHCVFIYPLVAFFFYSSVPVRAHP